MDVPPADEKPRTTCNDSVYSELSLMTKAAKKKAAPAKVPPDCAAGILSIYLDITLRQFTAGLIVVIGYVYRKGIYPASSVVI